MKFIKVVKSKRNSDSIKQELDKNINKLTSLQDKYLKVQEQIKELNFNPDLFDNWKNSNDPDKAYKVKMDYHILNDNITTVQKRIDRLENEYKDSLNNQSIKNIDNIKVNKEIPQVLIDYQEKLAKEFYESDIKLKEELIKERNNLKQDFYKDPRYNKEFVTTLLESNSETLERINNKRAEDFVRNLWDRINSKINNIQEIDLSTRGGTINGFVRGDNCDIHIQTILAGGPVQRLHNRCLFKIWKK